LNILNNMTTQLLNKKIELIQWLSTLEDNVLIEKLHQFKKKESKDCWETTSEQEKKSIEKGIKDADSKNLKPHTAARKLYEKWL
jgi:hypothetical protein